VPKHVIDVVRDFFGGIGARSFVRLGHVTISLPTVSANGEATRAGRRLDDTRWAMCRSLHNSVEDAA